MILKHVEQLFLEQLKNIYEVQESRELYLLGAEAHLNLSRSQVLMNPSKALSNEEVRKMDHLLDALKTGMPIQYALGFAWFYGLKLNVNGAVLIPRPETEELVEMILKESKEATTLIDLGTGSGCIPIAIKKGMPEMEVWGVDISTEALEVATENARQMDCLIHFVEADILSKDFAFPMQKFDVIVSNPPYITPAEQTEMVDNVLGYEPHLALFTPEERPLLFYEAIAVFAKKHLNENGKLYFEINRRFGKELKLVLEELGFLDVSIFQDLQGADRIIRACR